MRISDWSSDVCSSDLEWQEVDSNTFRRVMLRPTRDIGLANYTTYFSTPSLFHSIQNSLIIAVISTVITVLLSFGFRSEEHTSELQSLMRISYAVFCWKQKNQ